MQERAKMEAEMDDTWADVDDNDTSRNVSGISILNEYILNSCRMLIVRFF